MNRFTSFILALALSASILRADVDLLKSDSAWRWHISFRTPDTVVDGKVSLGGGHAVPAMGVRWILDAYGNPTPPPPADWASAEFDDSSWPRRAKLPLAGYGYGNLSESSLLCMRGYFAITDPKQVQQLKLNLVYRGGAIVYLNGSEIARAHMPAGQVTPLTLATAYENGVFCGADGAALPAIEGTRAVKNIEAYDKRTRTLNIAVPTDRLRAGTNVLAIEVHRTCVPEDVVKSKATWATCGVNSISLTASPDTVRKEPPAVQVISYDSHHRAEIEPVESFEPVRTMRLGCPRNGVASAQVMVCGKTEFPGISATLSELKSPQGTALPPGCLELRYAAAADFPALLPKAVNAAAQSVWITMRPPKNAPAGVYRGTLTIPAAGPTSVPVEATVYDYTLADLRDYNVSCSLLQSPEAVAGYYHLPMWSDAHFARLEKSLAMLGYSGNRLVSVAAIADDLFGDNPSILFKKEGDTWMPDFRYARRYLELYKKHSPEPHFVSIQIWNYNISRRGPVCRDGGEKKFLAKTLKVWQLEGDKFNPVEIPVYTDPGTEKTWSAVAEGMRQMMKDLGWTKAQLLWGTGGDNLPNEEIVEFFKKFSPDIYWRCATHGSSIARWGPTPQDRTQGNGAIIGYANLVRRNTTRRTQYLQAPIDTIKRDGFSSSPEDYFSHPPLSRIAAGTCGFGFVTLDYFTYTTPEGTQRCPLAVYAPFGNITPGRRSMLAGTPDGPSPTAQLEAVREGMQMTEAVLQLRNAIAARNDPRLTEEASNAIQSLLDVIESNRKMLVYNGAAGYRRWITRIYELLEAAAH